MKLPNWFSGLVRVAMGAFLMTLARTEVMAQLPAEALLSTLPVDSTARLEFRLGVVGYAKNNEYFNPHVEGYTLWGTQLIPTLSYRISPKAVLVGGVFWRNDFGAAAKALPEPILTLKLSHDTWNYLFGTLEGNLNHQLVEPLYNFERYLLTPIENGLQINHLGRKLFFDFWISNPQNTLPGYDRQEHFWGGISSRNKVVQSGRVSLDLITQATVFHAGGQGIRSSLPVRTAVNAALGFRAEYWGRSTGFPLYRLEPYWISYLEQGRVKQDGRAWYLNASVQMRSLLIMLSYWQGSGYRSVYGGDLYGSDSRSVVTPSFFEKSRNWVMLRFSKTLNLGNGLSLTARLEPMYDLTRSKFEHSEGIYLTYHLREKLGKK